MAQFSISNSLISEKIDLEQELKKLGFDDKEIDILISRKTLKHRFLSDSEYLQAIKSTLEQISPKNNLGGFLKILDINANNILKTKFSSLNQQSEIYIVSSMLEIGLEYSDAKRILRTYKSQSNISTPYDLVDVARRLYRAHIPIEVYMDRLFRALGEMRFIKDEFSRKEILFKYQEPPYVIAQEDFDIGVEILAGRVIIDNKSLYDRIHAVVSNRAQGLDPEKIYRSMIDDSMVESYSKLKDVLGWNISVIDLIASILYVSAGGRFRLAKNLS